MRYFLDTEFMEDGRTIELLSVGLVREDGQELYMENLDANWSRANPWVRANVLPYLDMYALGVADGKVACAKTIKEMRQAILDFCTEPDEIWTYYGSYDWVVFCQIFGTMLDLPEGFPMFTHDLRAWLNQHDLGHVRQLASTHHAIEDARWIYQTWQTSVRPLLPVEG